MTCDEYFAQDFAQNFAQYQQRMLPVLGVWRCRVINCLGFDNPQLGHYFNPPPEADLAAAFRAHLQQLWAEYWPGASDNEPISIGMAIIAAGLLTYGELPRVDYILNHVPPERIVLDHGCGWCALLAYRITAQLLPLPEEFTEYSSWTQGSPEVAQVKQWLQEHRSRLVWYPEHNRFILG
jgi:hypothetical protein